MEHGAQHKAGTKHPKAVPFNKLAMKDKSFLFTFSSQWQYPSLIITYHNYKRPKCQRGHTKQYPPVKTHPWHNSTASFQQNNPPPTPPKKIIAYIIYQQTIHWVMMSWLNSHTLVRRCQKKGKQVTWARHAAAQHSRGIAPPKTAPTPARGPLSVSLTVV